MIVYNTILGLEQYSNFFCIFLASSEKSVINAETAFCLAFM